MEDRSWAYSDREVLLVERLLVQDSLGLLDRGQDIRLAVLVSLKESSARVTPAC